MYSRNGGRGVISTFWVISVWLTVWHSDSVFIRLTQWLFLLGCTVTRWCLCTVTVFVRMRCDTGDICVQWLFLLGCSVTQVMSVYLFLWPQLALFGPIYIIKLAEIGSFLTKMILPGLRSVSDATPASHSPNLCTLEERVEEGGGEVADMREVGGRL